MKSIALAILGSIMLAVVARFAAHATAGTARGSGPQLFDQRFHRQSMNRIPIQTYRYDESQTTEHPALHLQSKAD